MATYIQGLTDYIPQIQPFQPDFNFFANVMQTKQTKYDAAKKRVNDLYGTLLYSPMLRDSNIKRRDEFFKVINGDIQRIAGLDLSRQENLDQALNVFQGFYDDDDMVRDMVKTKKVMAEKDKGLALKSCNDPKKCGGMYWDPGMQKLDYKIEEYKKLSDKEALNFDMGTYDPYFDWQKEAYAKLTEKGYKVEKDYASGNYIVHDENGYLVQDGLEKLMHSLYGDDPRVKANYETLSYVDRKNYARNNAQTFGSEEKAEEDYILKTVNQKMGGVEKEYKKASDSYNQLNNAIVSFKKKIDSGKGLTPTEQQAYDYAVKQMPEYEAYRNNLQSTINEIKNNIDKNDINSLRQRSDIIKRSSLFNEDITSLASSLADIKKVHTFKADPFKEIAARGAEERRNIKYRNQLETLSKDRDWMYKFKYLERSKELDEFYENQGVSATKGTKTGTGKAGETTPASGTVQSRVLTKEPGSDASLNIEENPAAPFIKNTDITVKKMNEANTESSLLLYQLFNEAKKSNDPTASDPLRANNLGLSFLNEFGNDWKNINSYNQFKAVLDKTGKNPGALLNDVANKSSLTTNPGGDYYHWAGTFFLNNADRVSKARAAYKASEALIEMTENNNRAAMKGIEADPELKDYTGLFLKNSMPVSKEEFTKRYLSKVYGIKEKDYDAYKEQREGWFNWEGMKDTFGQSKGDEADDIYDAMYEKFNKNYKEVAKSVYQGEGLEGLGQIKGNAIEFVGIDSGAKTKEFKDIMSTLSDAMANTATKVVTGGVTEDSYNKDHDDELASFMSLLYNEAVTASSKKEGRPKFNVKVNSIAGGRENISALTFSSLNQDFLKDYIGTEKEPGILYGKDLSKGITVFYDNTQLDTPFKEGSEMSNTEVILLTKGRYVDDTFKDHAGTVTYDYNKETNEVTVNGNYYYWENGQKKVSPLQIKPFDLSVIKDNENTINNILLGIQNNNYNTEQALSK